jgi:hypothetical protein
MINYNYAAVRTTLYDQRKRLREMIGKVDQEVYEDIRDVYLPTLVEDVMNAVPVSSGALSDNISFILNHTKAGVITLRVSAKAYNHGYNYAYIQHENVSYSHEHGTHHYISAPFENMIADIAGDFGLSYTPPANSSSVYGPGASRDKWSEGVESNGEK